jgi:hypothetical protein
MAPVLAITSLVARIWMFVALDPVGEFLKPFATWERDPRKLAELSHPRIQASRAEMIKSMEGNWRQELIFVLQQELEMYDTYQRRVAECDQELQKHLRAFAATVAPVKKELRFYPHGSLRQALDQCPT